MLERLKMETLNKQMETGETSHHEHGLQQLVRAVGHTVVESVTFLLTPYSHAAEESVRNASTDRLHEVNPFTMETPESWGSSRRT